jgi:hypothetical protein
MNGDRARTKPFSALLTEYARVLGPNNVPQRLEDLGPTFGLATTRWFLEPIPSAVFVQTAFEVAFEGCSKLIGSAGGNQGKGTYDVPPTLATASTECAGWAKRFWSRDATPEQIQACAQVALQTTRETYGRSGKDLSTRDTSPSRRWAYACASVLTATPFLTY